MPEKIFLLPDRNTLPLTDARETDVWARVPGPEPRVRVPWAEYIARIVEAVPADWSDMSGLLETSVAEGEWETDTPAEDTGYEFHRFGGVQITGLRVQGDRRETTRPRIEDLLVERKPPAFISFAHTGFDSDWKFAVARRLAAGFIRKGYLGWLSLNNGKGRDGAHETPAEVEIRLVPWSYPTQRPLPPAIVLRWEPRYRGHLEQFEPVLRICQIACREFDLTDAPSG